MADQLQGKRVAALVTNGFAFNRKMIEEIAQGEHGGAGKRQLAGAHA